MDSTIPKIRFRNFKEDWEKRKLGDELSLLKDGTHGTHKDVNKGPYLLSAKNIKNGKINISNNERKISLAEYDSIHKNFRLQPGDVLLTTVGSIGESAVLENSSGLTFQRSVAYLRTKNIDSQFLYRIVTGINFQKELLKRQVISAQPGIYLGDLAKINFHIANDVEEQVKIGEFFKQLDETINLHQHALYLLKRSKKAYLQKMFPKKGGSVPEIRFSDFTKDWDKLKVGEIFEKSSEKNENLEYDKEKIISVAKMKYKNNAKISNDNYMKTYNILKKNEIAFEGNKSKNFKYGRFVLNDIGDGIVSHVFIVMKPKIKMHSSFLKEYINNESVMQEILLYSTTSTLMMTSLQTNEFLKRKLRLPSLEEQVKIGNFFKQLDDSITLQEEKIESLKQMKKAFLQKMFV